MTEAISSRSTATAGEAIYVGAYVLRVGGPEGALAVPTAPALRPTLSPRTDTARILPPPAHIFLDRNTEVESARAEISAGRSIEFFGAEGVGKSTILAHLAHLFSSSSFAGDILYLSGRRATVDDLSQAIAQALYDSRDRVKVVAPQLRELALGETDANRRHLVLIDDLALEGGLLETLLAALPGGSFVVTSVERRHWGEGRSIAVEGLTGEDGLALFEHASGRPLPIEEQTAALTLVDGLGGRPQAVLLAVGLVRAEGMTAAEINRRLEAEGRTIESLAVDFLHGDEERMAGAMAALGGLDASGDDLAAIAGAGDPSVALDGLARRGVARRLGLRFAMAAPVADEIRRRVDLAPFEERATAWLAETTARQTNDPEWAIDRVAMILQLLEGAVASRRWPSALTLARAADGGLALAGRWGAWGRLLDLALQAARHLPDPAAEAWALHQRGTRALCLGEIEPARQDLEEALVLRDRLGDVEGAAISRRNLELVPGALQGYVAPPAPTPTVVRAGLSPWFFLALALGVVALVTIIVLAQGRRNGMREAGVLVVDGREIHYGMGRIGVSGDPRQVVVENDGEGETRVSSVQIVGPEAEDFVVVRDQCVGRTLRPGDRCSIEAAFVPSAPGERHAELRVETRNETRRIPLTGVVAAVGAEEGVVNDIGAIDAVNPRRVEFGAQEIGISSGELAVTFVNTLSAPARLAVRMDAGPSREFTIADDGCSNRAISAGSSCIVTLQFRPEGAGARGAVLVLREITSGETWTVPVSGAGSPAPAEGVEVEGPEMGAPLALPARGAELTGPERLTFPPQRRGTRSAIQVAWLENGTDREIRIANVRLTGLDSASFELGNDRCSGYLLLAGSRCALDVWFEPVEEGTNQVTLVVRDGAGSVVHEIELTGVGE